MHDGLLVVGLGNPGPEYAHTRHNLGAMVADELAHRLGLFSWQDKFLGRVATGRYAGGPVVLLKPLTFMNLSGRSVARAAGFYQIPAARIIVIHDELDLPFAAVRVKADGGIAGHKGLASLKQELGTTAFLRVRLGIDRPARGNVADYVLARFTTEQAATLSDFLGAGADAVQHLAEHGLASAMNKFNVRSGLKSE